MLLDVDVLSQCDSAQFVCCGKLTQVRFVAQVTLGINYFGAFYLTHLLADKLLQQPRSRIVFENSVSEVHGELNWDDLTYAFTLIVNHKQTASIMMPLHMHQAWTLTSVSPCCNLWSCISAGQDACAC